LKENKMKSLRQLCAVIVLTMALALTAFAGEMSTTVVDPSPPSEQSATEGNMTTMSAGQMGAGNADPATAVALNLLQSLLALL
jgi:hypothetical protein